MLITLETPIERTVRVQQVQGLFDLPDERFSRVRWDAQLPLDNKPWNIGLITGPSGCGKSTIARHLFRDALWLDQLPPWPTGQAVVDGFPESLSVREVTECLSAVGFSSPPMWLRPYSALSTGQRFRCDLARLMASLTSGQIAVFDEFTSVVDRTVAQVGSAALARTIRRNDQRFVAVTCHEDVIEWLQPDWVFYPERAAVISGVSYPEPAFARRVLRPRPEVAIEVVRTTRRLWPLFAPHHYLSHSIHRASVCFIATHKGRPIAFSAWLNQMSKKGGKREHRTVVLPDWQGIGLGMKLSSLIASMWKSLGYRATSTTTHPAFIAARKRSPNWVMVRMPSLSTSDPKYGHATTRLTAGFVYIGPAMSGPDAKRLLCV